MRVSSNRVAPMVANDKVMPMKKWLDKRHFLQGEMQQLRDKLAMAKGTAHI